MFFRPEAPLNRPLSALRNKCRLAASAIRTACRRERLRPGPSTSRKPADLICRPDPALEMEPAEPMAPAASLPARDSAAAWPPATHALQLRSAACAKRALATPTFPLLRLCSRALPPKPRQKLCRRKSFPSRFPSTLKKHAPSALRVRCFSKSFWNRRGNLRVLKIVHGLGHGLDDAAVHAAEQIRFKPALQDGQPSDSTVVLHIIFQLA